MEERTFYGIIDNECKISDVSLSREKLVKLGGDEVVFCCSITEGCIAITFSQEVGSGFQISLKHGEAIRNLVRSQSQKIPIPVVEVSRNI